MTKKLFIACHVELIAEAVENGMDEAEAYDKTADKAYDRMRDRYADMIDAAEGVDTDIGAIDAIG